MYVDPIKVYLILYGNWPASSCGPPVITSLINSLSDSSLDSAVGPTTRSWWKVATKFTQSNGQPVSSSISVAGTVHRNYTQGKSLHDAKGSNSTWSVITSALAEGLLPVDSKAMYMVLTSADVKVGNRKNGFCRGYCGFHSYSNYKGTSIKYGFTGDASSQCPGSVCNMNMGYGRSSPNSCYGADGMASTILHELAEIATNPTFWSWASAKNVYLEAADICSGSYMNGAQWGADYKWMYNVGGSNDMKFLVQPMFDPDKQKCANTP